MNWKGKRSNAFLHHLFSFLQRNKSNHQINFVNRNWHCSLVKMEDTDLLSPPKTIRGMKVLDKSVFNKTVRVPCIEIQHRDHEIAEILGTLKKYFLPLKGIRAVEKLETKTKILLNPNKISRFDDFDDSTRAQLKKNEITCDNFFATCLELTYDNYKADSILKAVLPEDMPSLTSYSLIGHIIHLNIKDHLLDYKYLISQVLLDKVPYAKTVVHKTNIIENVYRNFKMEILCGEPNLTVSVVEYGVKYEFDFSKVYWNPRLSTEHDRIVSLLAPGDALFDVFAGVGPFSIRAALKKCIVFANDLNPDSFKWLNHNIKLNKRSASYISTYNKDGKDFILEDIKSNLLKFWKDEEFNGRIYVVMNLPASALQFLKYFKGLITQSDLRNFKITGINKCLPIIHCHFFVKEPATTSEVFEKDSGIKFDCDKHKIHFVRSVSLGKGMYRATFEMPENYLMADSSGHLEEPLIKRICLEK